MIFDSCSLCLASVAVYWSRVAPFPVFSLLRQCQWAALCWYDGPGGGSSFYPNFYPMPGG
jgi:hypothetical protein